MEPEIKLKPTLVKLDSYYTQEGYNTFKHTQVIEDLKEQFVPHFIQVAPDEEVIKAVNGMIQTLMETYSEVWDGVVEEALEDANDVLNRFGHPPDVAPEQLQQRLMEMFVAGVQTFLIEEVL